MLTRQTNAESDEGGPKETVKGAADLRTADEVVGRSDDGGIGREPGDRERAKDESKERNGENEV